MASIIEAYNNDNYYSLENDNIEDSSEIITSKITNTCSVKDNDDSENINTKNEKKEDDITSILENDEFYDPKSQNLDQDDLNRVIDNLNIIDNEFIQNLKENNLLINNNYPNINDIINLYFSKYKEELNKFSNSKYFVFILNILYLLFITYIFIGWMSPYNLLIYHIIISVLFLIIYENKDNNSPFSLLIKFIFKKEFSIIPFDYSLFKKLVFIFIFLSFIGMLDKSLSLFNIIKYFIDRLSLYN